MRISCRDDTVEKRMNQKTTKSPDGCWRWTGMKVGRGYGMINTGRGMKLAHRESYRINVGPIADGLMVLHRCDVPECVNPEHLFLGTSTDNMQDMLTKGRGNKARGEQVANAKLTQHSVQAIRKSASTNRELSNLYNVSIDAVRKARTHKTWRHV